MSMLSNLELIRRVPLKYVIGWVLFATIIGVLGILGILTDFARAFAPEEMLDLVLDNSDEVLTGAWRSFAFVLVAAVAIALYRRGRLPMRIAGWSLALLAAIDSWTIMRHYWIFSPPAAVTYRSDAAIDKIKSDPKPSRVLALELETTNKRDTNLEGDGLMIHRVRTVLGYHGNQLGRYNEILQKDEGFIQAFNPKAWEIYNVRYLLTNSADVGQYFPGAQWQIGPVKDAAGVDVYLYRLPGDNPFAWVTPVIVKAPDESVAATLFARGFDPLSAALFAEDANVTGVDSLTMLPLPVGISVDVKRYEPGRISLELSDRAPSGSALVVSENYFPGWTAKVDGQDAPLGRADYTLIGVQLPAGGRSVELTFDDPAYERGKLVTLLALTLTALLIGGGVYMERKAIG